MSNRTPSVNSSLKAAALRSAAEGWPVFLLGWSKRPLANCQRCRAAPPEHDPQACTCLTCHGFYAATRDPKTVEKMLAITPSGLLAIRTGAPSQLVVVDVDPQAGGATSLKAMVRQGLTPPTRYVHTGSGGLHLYYRHPGPHTKIRCTASVLSPGIDIRADGGYAVAPPSIHPATRKPYLWADPCAEVVEMPPALASGDSPAVPATTGTAPPPRHQPSTRAEAGGISSPARLLAAHLDAVRRASEGRRRATLYGASRGVARIVAAGAISSADAHDALMQVGLAAGQTYRETAAAITGGFRDEGVTL